MKISPAKENILKRVRNALSQSVQLPFPNSEGNSSVFKTENEGLELKFAEEFTRLQGKFVFCTSKAELMDNLRLLCENKDWHNIYCQTPALLKMLHREELPALNQGNMHEADAAITDCEYLVARTGTVVLSAAQPSGRALPVYTPVHIMIAYTHQLVFDLKDAFNKLKDKYGQHLPSAISFATGPSRTADIEKTLVVGIHGPKEVYVFLVDE
ncbi:LutC/YkgG family protein [Chitinophaga nivalis]|uniref:LUD domain-containing protein n=1 Tax=Chitinophaga nivalis TaxID=2991709 RepID=A0ABT3IV82_9BACT|nr:lactate utilization protein [Chitinophaga nivalis]MCW3462709.1 LUD domain-containing protein [Chitinophaga nivalis]MCW3487600.1 LUD domain-containing protein [Chitinophaga nivalis]